MVQNVHNGGDYGISNANENIERVRFMSIPVALAGGSMGK
jgi:hypothetical protein